jgi:hypothetical protein
MRQSLAPLQGKRVRFSATYAGRSALGHIILSQVRGAVGEEWQHLWIPAEEWEGSLPYPGERVRVSALVDAYQRNRDNSIDFGLFSAREVRE